MRRLAVEVADVQPSREQRHVEVADLGGADGGQGGSGREPQADERAGEPCEEPERRRGWRAMHDLSLLETLTGYGRTSGAGVTAR